MASTRPNFSLTVLLVLLSWVFFRADDLSRALAYLAAMFGAMPLGPASGGAELLGALIYRPYYLLSFGIAGLIAFLAPQTWDWTRRLSPWKALACVGLLWLSLALLTSQAYNPFIYFIF